MTGGILKRTLLTLLILVSLVGTAHGQGNQCWTRASNGTWVYNPACSQTPNAPLVVAVGKQLNVNNTLTLQGIDNQVVDFSGLPQGTNILGSAALASSASFQPAGAGLNLVGRDTSTTITNGTGTQTFSVATGLSFSSGMIVTAYVTAAPSAYMQGTVTSYTSTTLVINATYSQGTYTGTGWTIQISGPQGPVGAAGTGGVPVGTLEFGAYASLPANYLWASSGMSSYAACVSTTTYATLYLAIGDVVTSSNGCTTGYFGIPDMGGKFPMGTSSSYAFGSGGGAPTHTLTAAELPANIPNNAHSHAQTGYTGNNGGNNIGWIGNGTYAGVGQYNTSATSIVINPGGGSAVNIMNPYFTGAWIIRYL